MTSPERVVVHTSEYTDFFLAARGVDPDVRESESWGGVSTGVARIQAAEQDLPLRFAVTVLAQRPPIADDYAVEVTLLVQSGALEIHHGGLFPEFAHSVPLAPGTWTVRAGWPDEAYETLPGLGPDGEPITVDASLDVWPADASSPDVDTGRVVADIGRRRAPSVKRRRWDWTRRSC